LVSSENDNTPRVFGNATFWEKVDFFVIIKDIAMIVTALERQQTGACNIEAFLK
jgi:hypothetical protein